MFAACLLNVGVTLHSKNVVLKTTLKKLTMIVRFCNMTYIAYLIEEQSYEGLINTNVIFIILMKLKIIYKS